MLLLPLAAPATAPAALACSATHWIGAWTASPSSGNAGLSLNGLLDEGLNLITPADDETIRAVLTPTYGGSTVRVHLSNRFGSAPVTFDKVTIGIAGSAGSLAGPPTTVTFGGHYTVTLDQGQDTVSDPVSFSFSAMQTLAVSMFVANDPGDPSTHYTAMQTSYLSGAGSGDHTDDRSGASFLEHTTTRPYVDGLDVLAPASAGAVVALGDSLTDGFQPSSLAIGESPAVVDTDRRYTDDLARRLIDAHIPLSVLNAGISGNLVQGPNPGSASIDGPPALTRMGSDVLAQAGVTTVIWEEGLNDIASEDVSAGTLEAAYTRGIEMMHAAGLRVLQGTLTPAGGSAATEATREQVNSWIRTSSPADGVIDFDAAVRDPSDPDILNPGYNGGDNEHLNIAGYQAMANAVSLSSLRVPSCTPAALKLTVNPTRLRAGTRTNLSVTVTVPTSGHSTPVHDATITIAGHHLHTAASGRTSIALRFARSGSVRITATATGYRGGAATIQVTPAAKRKSGHGQR